MYIVDRETKCANCGKISSRTELLSYHTSGTCDLDFRPDNYVSAWIKECPYCGYVAGNLSAPIDDVAHCRRIMASERYRSCDAKEFTSKSAGLYYKQYLLIEGAGNLTAEISTLLRAIWCSDDSLKDKANAAGLRRALIPKLLEQIEKSSNDQEEYETNTLVLIDCYRRISEFDRVIELCNRESFNVKPEYESARCFQRDLAVAKDDRRYDFASAYEHYPVSAPTIEEPYSVSLSVFFKTNESASSKTEIEEELNSPYVPLYNSMNEVFEHENEPDFHDKLLEYVSHMPTNRNTLYQIMEMRKNHVEYSELFMALFDLFDLMTLEERESC